MTPENNESDYDENDDGDESGRGSSGYKSHFKLSLESELFQQQVSKSPRTPRSGELNLSGNNYRQFAENHKAGKYREIPQTEQQHTKSLSANYSKNVAATLSTSQTILRQRQAELSPRLVDKMQKYHPVDNTVGASSSQTSNNSATKNTQYSPRQNSGRMSKVVLSPREFDLSESLYPERIISPQSTQRYIQVSRLALQTRMGGDGNPTNGELNNSGTHGYPSPPGSPGCEGAAQYQFVKQQAVPERMTGVVFGQGFGEPYVSPARKRLEAHRPASGRQSATGQRSPGPSDSNPNTTAEDVHVVEFQGGLSGFKTKPGYLKSYARKK
ncbi:uncharacterized protein [Amphiura filiformis]|uniref:uncharacterized protein n=1 Tax=Amphiura filiformis TaxID=82378 RepID=UPI003B21F424